MADVALDPTAASLLELYRDLVWNLAASARTMRLKLPAFASAASDPDLLILIADVLRRATESASALEAIASRADRPARVHAAELEALLSTAGRETAGWASGKAHDVALAAVLRTALHLAIPSYEVAMSLAPVVGYAAHRRALSQLGAGLGALDSRLQEIVQSLLGTQGTTEASTTGTMVAETEGPR